MNKYIITPIILLWVATTLFAIDSDAGKYGFQFLKIPAATSLAAMANTGEMNQYSPLTILQHPAAFDWKRGKYVAASQTSWLVDTNLYNIAYRNVMFDRSWGLALKYVDHGQFEKRTDNGTLIGYYYPMDLNFAINYAHKLTPDIHAGINLNYIYEKIDTSSAMGFTTDLGLVYRTPIRNTNIDIAFKNIGFTTKMDEEKIDLPFTTELGLATGYEYTPDFIIYPAVKAIYMNDHDDILPAIGVDFRILEILDVKFGYKINYNEEDFSAGIGVIYHSFSIDYAFMNFKNDLDKVHMFGVGYRF